MKHTEGIKSTSDMDYSVETNHLTDASSEAGKFDLRLRNCLPEKPVRMELK